MIKRFCPRQVLGSIVEGKSLLAEVMLKGSETVDLDTNETGSICFS